MRKVFLTVLMVFSMTQCFAMRQVVGGTSGALGTTNPAYFSISGGGGVSNVELGHHVVIPYASTLTALKINLNAAPGAGTSRTFTVRVNAVDTGLACVIADAATSCSNDTILNLAAGNYVSMKEVPSGATAASRGRISLVLNGGSPRTFALLGGNFPSLIGSLATIYMPLHGVLTGISLSATQFDTQTLMPLAGTVRNLYVNCSAAPTGGATWTFAVMKGGSAQANTCSMVSPATTCNDTAHSFAFVAGDILNMRAADGGVSGVDPGNICAVSVSVESANKNEYLASELSQTVTSAAADRYACFNSGQCAVATAEATATSIIQTGTISQAQIIKNIYVSLSSAPGVAKSYDFTLRQNTASTSTTVNVSGTDTIGNAAGSVTVADSDLVDTLIHPNGTPATTKVSISYLMSLKQRRIL